MSRARVISQLVNSSNAVSISYSSVTGLGALATANTVGAAQIDNGAVTSAKLYQGANKLVQTVYQPVLARTTYNAGLNSYDNAHFYNADSEIQATITKQYADTVLVVHGQYGYRYSGGAGLHFFMIRKVSGTVIAKNFSLDPGRVAYDTDRGAVLCNATAIFTAAECAAGEHTFGCVPCRGNYNTSSFTRNPNQSDVGDYLNGDMISYLMIQEIFTS